MKFRTSLAGLCLVVGLLADAGARVTQLPTAAVQSADPTTANSAIPAPSYHDQVSPGIVLGTTWMDESTRGSATRRLDFGVGNRPLLHYTWVWANSSISQRNIRYGTYDFAQGAFGAETDVYLSDHFPAYVDMDLTDDNRAVISAIRLVQPDVIINFRDQAEGLGDFSDYDIVPADCMTYEVPAGKQMAWPRMTYVEGPTDTVLHILGHAALDHFADEIPLSYFRRVGGDDNPDAVWDYPPLVLDTTAIIAYDVASTDDGRVALVWTANVPCGPADDDTASGYDCHEHPIFNNDIYYLLSDDNGYTWHPRENLTRYTRGGADSSFRAYHDISAMFTADGDFHILFTNVPWPITPWDSSASPPFGTTGARICHWSSYADSITVVYDALWNQTTCNGGWPVLNVRDVSIAECRGRLYALFTQFNDAPAGILDDCASSTNKGFPLGAANGDMYLSVSSDNGLNWDYPRNLTNTRSPGCESPTRPGGPCASEVYVSVPEHGTDIDFPGEPATDIVIPAGGTDPGWYLDVAYLEDRSAGFALQGEGYYAEGAAHWFRLACVDPIYHPTITIQPQTLDYPIWAPNCSQREIPLIVTNAGNGEAVCSVTAEETTGPSGWLSVTGLNGTIGPGGESDTGTVILNTGGVVCNPGTTTRLTGRLRLDSNDPASPHFVDIDIPVADTVIMPRTDTLATACLALAVSNDGSLGGEGAGNVNLDFVADGDCDPNASVYLYDASPVIAVIDDFDTVINWSAYGSDFLSPHGFVPLGYSIVTDLSGMTAHHARFTTSDSSINMSQTIFAPEHPDSCQFVIRRLEIVSDAGTDALISIGDIIDWDIPSDSGVRNGSDTLPDNGLIFQYGAEYHGDDSESCQYNDRRFGGVLPLGAYVRTDVETKLADRPFAAVTRANADFVYGNQYGLDPNETTEALRTQGYDLYATQVPESTFTDLHTLVTYLSDVTVNPGETLVVYSALMTVRDGDPSDLGVLAGDAADFFCRRILPDPPGCGCCENRGDVNGVTGSGGAVNVSDVTYLVDFFFRGGPPPPCPEEANVNNSTGDGNQVNVTDLTYLIDFLFRGGPPPPPC